jgi:ABC-type phosphate transport system auxiliary subunit
METRLAVNPNREADFMHLGLNKARLEMENQDLHAKMRALQSEMEKALSLGESLKRDCTFFI